MQRGVDRKHGVVLGDDVGRVHIVDRTGFERGIVVQEVVKRLVAHGEGEDRLAEVQALGAVVDYPGLDQADEAG